MTLPKDSFFMILEDHLPGGMEALNEKLNTTSHIVTLLQAYNGYSDIYYYEYGGTFYWQDYGYNNKEIHDERVSFFVKEMDKGKHVYTYLVRATCSGEFIPLPAEAYAMYDDRVWGRSSGAQVVIEAK